MVFLRAVALLACLFVPGWGFSVALKPRLRGEEVPFFLVASGAGINALAALGLGLAGTFNLGAHLALVASLSLPLLIAGRKYLLEPLRVRRGHWALSLAIVIIACLVSLPPGRTVFGWSDVGVYPCIAAHMAREGSIHLEVPTVREVAPERRELVYSFDDARGRPFQAHENKAYFITDFSRGKVVPQFYYLWPSFMAVFAVFLGEESLFFSVTAAAVLSLWGFFLLARRILGGRVGLALTVLLGISPLYIYFSKYTTSEMMNSFLLMAAAIAACAWLERDLPHPEGRPGWDGVREAVTSAFFVFLCFLCRVDFVLFLLPLLSFALIRRLSGRLGRVDLVYLFSCLGGFGLATLVGWSFSRPYLYELWLSFKGYLGSPWAMVAVALFLALIAAGGPLRRWLAGWPGDKARRMAKRAASAFAWLAAASAFAYLYAIRPGRPSPEAWFGVISAVKGSTYTTQTFLRWGWYFSTFGLVLIYGGLAAWFYRRRRPEVTFCGLVGLVFILFYSYELRCTPIHMLTMRRLVPAALPFSLLAVGMGLGEVERWSSRLFRRFSRPVLPGRIASALALLYLVAYFANASVPAMGLSEGGNQLGLCREVAEAAGEGSVVLLDFHLGDLFGPPLRSFFGLENAWIMDNSRIKEGSFRELLKDLGWESRGVFLLWRPSMSGPRPITPVGVRAERVDRWWCEEVMLEKTFERRPSRRTLYSYPVELYRLLPAEDQPSDPGFSLE